MTYIGPSAFQDCSNLTSVIIEPNSSFATIDVSCFKDSILNSLTYENITYTNSISFDTAFSSGTIETNAFLGTPFLSK